MLLGRESCGEQRRGAVEQHEQRQERASAAASGAARWHPRQESALASLGVRLTLTQTRTTGPSRITVHAPFNALAGNATTLSKSSASSKAVSRLFVGRDGQALVAAERAGGGSLPSAG